MDGAKCVEEMPQQADGGIEACDGKVRRGDRVSVACGQGLVSVAVS